jgi:hypothetical protein
MTADKWDVEIFEKMLKLARTKGPSHIRIVAGDEPCTYKVTIDDRATKAFYGLQMKCCRRK